MKSALGELIGRLGLLWLDERPFSKESRARRKAKRAARKKARKGEPLTPEEQAIMAEETAGEPTKRTSTKSGGTMGAGTAVIALVGLFFPEAMDSMSPETAAVLASFVTALVGWVVARVSKTPANPGAL